jgi:indole-3-glycerol phosphate synthase
MVQKLPGILSKILAVKRKGLPEIRSRRDEFERLAGSRGADHRSFHRALSEDPPAVIAEVKKASPSKGVFVADFRPAEIAAAYASGGAAALSVLTDEEHFQGSLADLAVARDAVPLPVLRKDFTLDEAHVVQAAAHGADAILLIAAALSERQMRDFRELAARFGLSALVEVHNSEELGPALGSGAAIVGVNNRNLHTFEVTLETSLRLAEKIPDGVLKVSESGIHGPADVKLLSGAGYRAFLVGEHLMKAGDPAAALRELRS